MSGTYRKSFSDRGLAMCLEGTAAAGMLLCHSCSSSVLQHLLAKVLQNALCSATLAVYTVFWLQGSVVMAAVLCLGIAAAYWKVRRQVFLVDFACYTPAKDWNVTWQRFMAGSRDCGVRISHHSECCISMLASQLPMIVTLPHACLSPE